MPRTAFPEFSALPVFIEGRGGFLYVLETSDGRVKVGRTGSPRQRMYWYGRDLAKQGVRVLRYAFEQAECHVAAEREMVARLSARAQSCSGHAEWFRDLRFGDACTLVRQMARRQFITA